MGPRLAAATLALALPGASALGTTPLQKKAYEAGFPARDCNYCHSFALDHMHGRGRQLGIDPRNCGLCHGNRLPKTGLELYNDRGRFLLTQKLERKAAEVDVQWLKDYVEKDAGKPREKPKEAP